ncbi:DUF3181 family protein [Pseudanabaena sp. PCC 6802]|uniref:DUF3181 family protein n=1 Tax=Pseudanabaena sp. PCC 6802 TaxID=118173 RepID=UPI00036D18C4
MTSESIEKLAAAIAEEVYIDIAKWHLYLGEAHLHTVLAEKFYPMLADGINADAVDRVLGSTMVKVGGGKRELPLNDLVPTQAQSALLDVLRNFED